MVVVLALAIGFAVVRSSDSGDAPDLTDPSGPVPHYTVLIKDLKARTGNVELLVPDATIPGAQDVIRSYSKLFNRGEGMEKVDITVVRSETSKVYVCSGRWLKDGRASELYTGGDFTADRWPAIRMNCPDPDGPSPGTPALP
ncbi:hypothetical protein B4N89_20625 [Embleya scabrispora]|uniref:Uncharacterized protein n=1 Tax=Embleya scabrispora TaxID=159449 RepID=A0A1T3P2A3_9ACTN|nr:hypothetical protein B4N89_20625 [Embleya scabrispora]